MSTSTEARLAALLAIAKDVSGELELDAILARVLPRIAAVLPCDRVITYYWDPRRNAFRDIARYGLTGTLEREAAAIEFPAGHPLVEQLAVGRPVVANDMLAQSFVPIEMLTHFGVCAYAAVPLMIRDRRLGALVAVSTQRGVEFEPSQVELLESIARQVAVALETTELYRVQREETQIAAALARVGRELISALDTPLILDRLCQLTTEVLGSDCSHTLLLQPKEGVYVPMSAHGYPAEEWEAFRVLKLPRAMFKAATAALARDDIANVDLGALPAAPTVQMATRYGLTRVLIVALRRGGEIIGLLVTCYRGRHDPFTPQQERVARGIAQLASLALENARLVEELERASGLKSEFVATMSHELRTPLNVIVGYTDLLRDEAFGPLTPDQAETLARVDNSAHQLLDLINTTLDMSRLEAGRLPLDVRDVNLPDLLREIDAETRELQGKSGLRFVWQVPAALPRLHTDPMKLKVVLKNLIGNAVKFTERGQVTVQAQSCNGQVEISVTDTGVGIAPEAREVIFEAFRQADGSMTRRFGGVGLGLYIVRRLLERLGGTISVDSEVGRGSTFHVYLPAAEGETG